MEQHTPVKMGKLPPAWGEGTAKSITFCVTEDCNLACKYCYMTGKNSKNKMTFEVAKKAVDYILTNHDMFPQEAVVWDFIGGEPFLEIDLIDRVSDYIKQQMFLMNHPWFDNYRFSFSSNGILYDTPGVQNYIRKNRGHIYIGISVDGNKLKHDLQRVRPDGSGSYDDVVRNVPLWLKQFPGASTKATFAHDDLPYLKDSIASLWNLGIKIVAANVVFEDVWEDGDDLIFENQLKELADYILENKLWKDYSVRFFDPYIGHKLTQHEMDRNYCGAGNMLAVDTKGNFSPCVRFYDMSLNHKKSLIIGDINSGIDENKLRPFKVLSMKFQSNQECIDCEIAGGCSWCSGGNYDMADSDTIFQRATYLCKMHKANVRASEYFWDNFAKVTGLPSEREIYRKRNQADMEKNSKIRYLQFITKDTSIPHCSYTGRQNGSAVMDKETFHKGLKFTMENEMVPVFLGTPDYTWESTGREYYTFVSADTKQISADAIAIYDNGIVSKNEFIFEKGMNSEVKPATVNCVLLVNRDNLSRLAATILDLNLMKRHLRINICHQDIDKWEKNDINIYQAQLNTLSKLVIQSYREKQPREINVLTDILNMNDIVGCDAGTNTFALAPNGKIYFCPAFYFDNPSNWIGSLDEGINIKNKHLLELNQAPVCSMCDAYHCARCKYLSKKMTGEYHVPSKVQCVISHIERNQARELQEFLENEKLIPQGHKIPEIDYLDPLDKIVNQ